MINDDYCSRCAEKTEVCIERLQQQIACLQAELDAAIKDLTKVSVCGTCAHYAPHSKGKCSKHPRKWIESNFAGCTCWQWRGAGR